MRRLSPSLMRTTLRAASRPTIQPSVHSSWRHVVRRAYASGSEHDSHSSGSDIPWAIGSAAVFFPSAYYLWQQGPEKTTHSHGHDHDEGEHEEGDHEGSENEGGDKKEGSEQGESADKGDSGDDTAENPPTESGEESDPEGSDETPQTSDEEGSVGGEEEQSSEDEGQTGKKKSKLDKRREVTSDVSKSNHPYMEDPNRSTKAEGVKETAKLSGTVDPYRKAR